MGVGVDIVILANCKQHFIRVHKNLVKHPSNNIFIVINCLGLVSRLQLP